MRNLFVLPVLASLAACVVVERSPEPRRPVAAQPTRWKIARPIDAADRVLVVPGTDLGRHVVVLGAIDLRIGSENEDEAFDALRHAALPMGADAVISMRFVRTPGVPGANAFGVAVRSLVDPESWTPLVVLDVDASHEDEASAVGRLLAAGRGLGDVAVVDFGWVVVGDHLHARATAMTATRR